MKVTISLNEKKRGIELYFDEALNNSQSQRLRDLGFKKTREVDPAIGFKPAGTASEKWFVKDHPAYREYANNLEKALELGVAPLEEVAIFPSFKPGLDNIKNNRFSVVTILVKEGKALKKEDYVVFDQYLRIAKDIATKFAQSKHGDALKEVKVFTKTYKPKARELLKADKYLDGKKEYSSDYRESGLLKADQPSKETKNDWSSLKKLDILKHVNEHGYEYYFYVLDTSLKEDGTILCVEDGNFESEVDYEKGGVYFPISELEPFLTQDELKEKYGYNFHDVDQLVKKVNNPKILEAESYDWDKGASFVKYHLYKDDTPHQKTAFEIIRKSEEYLKSEDSKQGSSEEATERIEILLPADLQFSVAILLLKKASGEFRFGLEYSKCFELPESIEISPEEGDNFSSRQEALEAAVADLFLRVANMQEKGNKILDDPEAHNQNLHRVAMNLSIWANKESIEPNFEIHQNDDFPTKISSPKPKTDSGNINEEDSPADQDVNLEVKSGHSQEGHELLDRQNSIINSKGKDYVYDEYQAFWIDVLLHVAQLKDISRKEALEILQDPKNNNFGLTQFLSSEFPRPSLALSVAKKIIKGDLPELDKSRQDNLKKFFEWWKRNRPPSVNYDSFQTLARQWTRTKEYDYDGEVLEFVRLVELTWLHSNVDPLIGIGGIYTHTSAGDRFGELIVSMPKSIPYELTLFIVQDSDDQYRSSAKSSKKFGDVSYTGGKPNIDSKQHADWLSALCSAIQMGIDRIEELLKISPSVQETEKLQKVLSKVYAFKQSHGCFKDENNGEEQPISSNDEPSTAGIKIYKKDKLPNYTNTSQALDKIEKGDIDAYIFEIPAFELAGAYYKSLKAEILVVHTDEGELDWEILADEIILARKGYVVPELSEHPLLNLELPKEGQLEHQWKVYYGSPNKIEGFTSLKNLWLVIVNNDPSNPKKKYEISKDQFEGLSDSNDELSAQPHAWMLTKLEYQQLKAIEKTGSSYVLNAKDGRDHEAFVEKALKEGKPVPEKVKEDYPWMVEENKETPKTEFPTEEINDQLTQLASDKISNTSEQESDSHTTANLDFYNEFLEWYKSPDQHLPAYQITRVFFQNWVANKYPKLGQDWIDTAWELWEEEVKLKAKISSLTNGQLAPNLQRHFKLLEFNLNNPETPEQSEEDKFMAWAKSNYPYLTDKELEDAKETFRHHQEKKDHRALEFLLGQAYKTPVKEIHISIERKDIPGFPQFDFANAKVVHSWREGNDYISKLNGALIPKYAVHIVWEDGYGTHFENLTQSPTTKSGGVLSNSVFDYFFEMIDNPKAWPEELVHTATIILSDYQLFEIEEEDQTPDPLDYLDKVIAYMHDFYYQEKRATPKQIEKLADELNVPNMGMMWEAVELSWFLWYKSIYLDSSSFELRLERMTRFWNKVQPTYAYADSSKILYQQYSTPCPISAIIAEYTNMSGATRTFEPSAGNGLLVLGADPSKTHVNEIDATRLKSLEFQGFSKITHLDATQPFPDDWAKTYDVVVSNPPFSKWVDDKWDKEHIIGKYFHNQIGLAKHIRLEHMMAGLALQCLKDNGRAAIIIMGHLYFDDSGYLARYRPFFNWLYRHYYVDDVINMNGFKLYNRQGAVAKTMLILIRGRKPKAEGVAPQRTEAPSLNDIVESFSELWERVQSYLPDPHYTLEKPHSYTLQTIIDQLKIELE